MNNKRNKYHLTFCTVKVNEEESITSYGVEYRENGSIVKEIKDISPNKTAVEKLIQEMNTSDLAPIHLEEVVEDKYDELI